MATRGNAYPAMNESANESNFNKKCHQNAISRRRNPAYALGEHNKLLI
jgi:hypothetical protein